MTSYEGSLIGKLKAEADKWIEDNPWQNGYNRGVHAAIDIIRQHTADGTLFIAKREGATVSYKPVCGLPEIAQTSEISVSQKYADMLVSDYDFYLSVKDKSPTLAAMIAVMVLTPYLHTTEPVTVSLQKCARAAAVAEGYNPDIGGERGGKIELNWEAHIAVTKAVLDAAGVKYHE